VVFCLGSRSRFCLHPGRAERDVAGSPRRSLRKAALDRCAGIVAQLRGLVAVQLWDGHCYFLPRERHPHRRDMCMHIPCAGRCWRSIRAPVLIIEDWKRFPDLQNRVTIEALSIDALLNRPISPSACCIDQILRPVLPQARLVRRSQDLRKPRPPWPEKLESAKIPPLPERCPAIVWERPLTSARLRAVHDWQTPL
jgi:hypothetical protein